MDDNCRETETTTSTVRAVWTNIMVCFLCGNRANRVVFTGCRPRTRTRRAMRGIVTMKQILHDGRWEKNRPPPSLGNQRRFVWIFTRVFSAEFEFVGYCRWGQY